MLNNAAETYAHNHRKKRAETLQSENTWHLRHSSFKSFVSSYPHRKTIAQTHDIIIINHSDTTQNNRHQDPYHHGSSSRNEQMKKKHKTLHNT